MRTAQQPTFEELYSQYGDGLYRYCFRLCRGNEADAEDLAQETLILAFRHLEGFRGKSKVQTWLYRIALNVHLKRRKGPAGGEELDEEHDPGVDPTGGQLTRLWLESGLASLPEALYQAIVLVKAEGLTHKEAAAVLGVPQGTVQFRVHEAVKRLRKILTEDPRSPYVGAFLPANLLDTHLSQWGNVTAPPSLKANVLHALHTPPVGGYTTELPASLRPSVSRAPKLSRRAMLAGGSILGLLLGGTVVVKTRQRLSPTRELDRTLAAMREVRTARATGTLYQGDVSSAGDRVVNVRRYRTDYAFRDPASFARRLTPLKGGAIRLPEELVVEGDRAVWNRGRKGGIWRTTTEYDARTLGQFGVFDFFSGHPPLAQALSNGARVTTTRGDLNGEAAHILTVQQRQTSYQRTWKIHASVESGRVLRCEYVKHDESRGAWLQTEYALLDRWEYYVDLPETIFRPSPRPWSE